MIEIINERPLEQKQSGLPKNIRQIGEREKDRRIYIEDYVITYLNQLRGMMKEEQRVLILYGHREVIDHIPTWFINGVLETEAQPFYETTFIDEHDWHEINEKAARFFPKLSVLGWALIGQESVEDYMDQIELTWRQFFREDQEIFFYSSALELTEELYCFRNGRALKQSGYYIYYEKNENMQNYMLSSCSGEDDEGDRDFVVSTTESGNDRATRKFRTIVQEKKEELHRKRIMSFLYAASSLFVMVIMVIGITMLNNYEKMENMENTLKELSGQVEDGFAKSRETRQVSAMEKTEIPVKESGAEMEESVPINLSTPVSANNAEEGGNTGEYPQRALDDENNGGEEMNTKQEMTVETDVAKNTEEASDIAVTEGNGDGKAATNAKEEDQGKKAGDMSTGQSEGANGAAQQGTDDRIAEQVAENGDRTPETMMEETDQTASVKEKENHKAEAADTPTDHYTVYVVKRGDTLQKICIRFYGDDKRVEELCRINQIKNRDKILYGQKILLP